MTSLNQKQLTKLVIDGLRELNARDPATNALHAYVYEPRPELRASLSAMQKYVALPSPTKADAQKAGYLLEDIAALAFSSIKGWHRLQAWKSVGAQLDLHITGDGADWEAVAKSLFMGAANGIVVEAKATADPVGDAQFARLCAIIRDNMKSSVGLGVFFTLNGASGFPQPGAVKGAMSDAWLRQTVFHAHAGIPVVVLDWNDVRALDKPGALTLCLRNKVIELEQCLPSMQPVNGKTVTLPARLKKYGFT